MGKFRTSLFPINSELNMRILIELYFFLRKRKKFWLAPFILVMLGFGGLLIIAQGSAVGPFIYTLF